MALPAADGPDSSSRWLVTGVLVALVGELALAIVFLLGDVLRSRVAWRVPLAALGFLWLLALVSLVWKLVKRLHSTGESLRDQSHRFALTAAISGEWVWQASPELLLTFSSPATVELLGYQPDELLGRSLVEFLDPADAPRAQAIWAAALAHDTGWEDVGLCWRRGDGGLVQLLGTAAPVHDTKGRLIGYQGVQRGTDNGTGALELRELHARMEATLDERALSIALQPIVNMGTGDLFAVEALVRFSDGRSPALWFADAHKIGKGIELELAAMEHAIELLPQLPTWMRVCINASPTLIVDERFRRALEREGLAERITIEITEHSIIAEYGPINEALVALRRAGLRVSTDDTGAGYASFSHVLQLQPDTIKIDRSWLSEVEHHPAQRALCTAARSLADNLGAILIAEGVERESQLVAITNLGIEYAQGYLFARPSTDPQDWLRWRSQRWDPVALAS